MFVYFKKRKRIPDDLWKEKSLKSIEINFGNFIRDLRVSRQVIANTLWIDMIDAWDASINYQVEEELDIPYP